MTTQITTPAQAVGITAHVDINPPRELTHDDHPSIPEDETFVADAALWSWSRTFSRVSLHGAARYCLAYYFGALPVVPEWLPRPPAEWDAAAAALIDTLTAQP